MDISFDKFAGKYDEWFLKNENVLKSELQLLALTLQDAEGKVLSVGCGSGLFEKLLKENYDIEVKYGIEPAEGMAEIARKRGMEVEVSDAETYDFGKEKYNLIYFNGSSSYITDLEKAYRKAYDALEPGGELVLLDVPKDSGFGILYLLAAKIGNWNDPLLIDIRPEVPYPVEFLGNAKWQTTDAKAQLLTKIGFKDLGFAQTLTAHPKYANDECEEPMEGYGIGNYVSITALKK